MKRQSSSLNTHHQGFSLIELMIAISIGLFIVLVVSSVYLSSKTSFRYQENMSRMQENARFAMDTISRDVRNAGFNGCGDFSSVANVVNNASSTWYLDFGTPLLGYEGGASAFPAALTNVVSGTDALVLMGPDTISELTISGHNPTSATIDTNPTQHSLKPGEILVVSDCKHTSIFQMTGPTNTNNNAHEIVHNTGNSVSPGNCNKELGSSCPTATSYTFSNGATISRLYSNAYYIAPASSGNGNSLWVRSLAGSTTGSLGTAQEIAQGVENMQIEYGLDTDGDKAANNYAKANAIATADWPNVVSVRLSLLLTSREDNLSSTRQSCSYNSTTSTTSGKPPLSFTCATNSAATDRRVRRAYSTTINVRNRTL